LFFDFFVLFSVAKNGCAPHLVLIVIIIIIRIIRATNLSKVSDGSVGLEGGLELGVRGAQHSVGQGESDRGVVELLDILASAVLRIDFLNVNDLNGAV
jgi:hypothetical protein